MIDWLTLTCYLMALVAMIYAAVLAFKGEVLRPCVLAVLGIVGVILALNP